MDLKIFNHPRPKKSLLPPPSKRRKTEHKIDEINFDFDARADYLTGFHKRKVHRAKQAQLEAEKRAKEERIVLRKQLREERRQELEEHVQAVNAILKDTWTPAEEADAGEVEWGGIADDMVPELVDHEEEYVDEDKYTTVTVEEVDVSKEGLVRVAGEVESEDTLEADVKPVAQEATGKKKWPKKERKKKFRYESKAERKVTRGKQKAGNKARADARRGND